MDDWVKKLWGDHEKDMERARKIAEEVSQLKYVKESLEKVVMPKIELDGYCSAENLWRSLPDEIIVEGEKPAQGVEVKLIVKIVGKNPLQTIKGLLEKVDFTGSFSQCRSILALVFSDDTDEGLSSGMHAEFLITLLEKLELIKEGEYRHVTNNDSPLDIIYPQNRELELITSLHQLMEIVEYNEDIWYRGQDSINYSIKPALFRGEYRECDMCQDALEQANRSFANCKTRFDKLVIMQHYGIPTRLLDVTSNPLIALYFACLNEDSVGELIFYTIPHDRIYPPDDVRVAELSCLSALSSEEQKALKDEGTSGYVEAKKHLISLIREEHFDYNDEPKLDEPIFVMPNRNNDRLQRQKGAFFLFGLSEKGLSEYRGTHIYRIGKEQKEELRKDLVKVGIDEGFVYPEIEHIFKSIKDKYTTNF